MATRRAARRGRAGSEELDRLRKALKQGWPPGLTVLTGDDTYHLDLAQRDLLSALAPPEDAEFALTVFGQERVDTGSVVGAARSAGMFASRRVVLVRDLLALDGEPEPLQEYAAAPPSQSYLLVRAPAPDLRRKLHKAILTSGTTLSFLSPPPDATRAMVANLSSVARDRGLELESKAAMLLHQLYGADLHRVAGELDKLRAWMGEPARRVTTKMVREVVSSGGMVSGWEVAEAVMARDRSRALAEARRLVDAGEEPIRIIGGMAWRTRKALQDARRSGAGRYSIAEILRFPSVLLEADRTLKSRSIHARAVLEQLVTTLVGEPADRTTPEKR